MNNNMANSYINFVCNALVASNTAVDNYFKENQKDIEAFAEIMHQKAPIKVEKIYRGLLMEEALETLEPLPHIQFLSFSEDKKVAYDFADINSDISVAMRMENPNAKGYIIEYTPQKNEILFHHSWVDLMGLDWYLPKGSIELIREQKEVMLKQNMREFKLERV